MSKQSTKAIKEESHDTAEVTAQDSNPPTVKTNESLKQAFSLLNRPSTSSKPAFLTLPSESLKH